LRAPLHLGIPAALDTDGDARDRLAAALDSTRNPNAADLDLNVGHLAFVDVDLFRLEPGVGDLPTRDLHAPRRAGPSAGDGPHVVKACCKAHGLETAAGSG